MKTVQIENKKIGQGYKPYIVAEISANHNGSLEKAIDTIKMIHNTGADAVKLQTYTADTMTLNSHKSDFLIKGGLWNGRYLYDLYKEAQTPYDWHQQLFHVAKKIGITIFSTPYDETALDLLESLNCPAYKIASFELVDLPLIKYIAETKKPIIMSTGMANYEEIQEAVHCVKDNGCRDLIILHCVSGYPTPIEQCNLHTIPLIENTFDCISGLSDHTLGSVTSIAAVALGASVIEKHVTLSRADKSPDSPFSLEPEELQTLCVDVENAWKALGKGSFEQKEVERLTKDHRRSVYFASNLKKGDIIRKEDIRRIRPGYGLAPKFFDEIVGKRVSADVDFGTATSWELIEVE